jgi:maltose/moltooligosaccharide transporter
MSSSIMAPSTESGKAPRTGPIYAVGTLRYNQQQLFILFFWLMWNDFSITLIEQVGGVGQFIMRDQGATFTEMSLLGSIGFFLPWLNPWVSTWSDRYRSKWGRRRPFLFIATPFFAFFLAAYPYMPTFYHYLLRYPLFAELSTHFPIKGEILFLGICGFVGNVFNGVVLAIFSYLYMDVVPESHMGRFQSLSKNAALLAGLFCSFFLFSLADHHMKAVYVFTASFCLVVYLASVWQIKEGEYLPPDAHKKGGMAAPVRAYLMECFGEPYYLWVFVASFLSQWGNVGGWFQSNYLHYDLRLDLGTIGWVQGWAKVATLGLGMTFGFALGSMTDRLKPVRLMGPIYIILGLVHCGSFYLVHDKWSYLVAFCLVNMLLFFLGVAFGAFQVEIFPREKFGQFCSAQAVFYQFLLQFLTPLTALLFDHLHNNRLGFLWQGAFYLLAALAYIKVFLNWRKRHGRTPVPHAG